MLLYESFRADRPSGYHAELYADRDALVVRADDPGGVNVVACEPTIDGDAVIVEVGLWSGGNPGVHAHCLRVVATGDWWTRVYFRQPDGGRVRILGIETGDRARAVASECGARMR